MIPKDHETSIIQSGLVFLKSITEAYGTDEGMKLWDNILTNLDPDIKGKIFFAMVTGEYTKIIKLTSVDSNYEKIKAIRTVRKYTDYGLKQSKDLFDLVELGVPQQIEVDPQQRIQAINDLRACGVYL